MREARLFAPAAIMAAGCLLLLGVRRQYQVSLEDPLRAMPVALAGTEGRDKNMTEEERRATAVSD